MSPANPSDSPDPALISTHSPTGASQHYAIELMTSEEGLAALKDDWNRLSDTAELPNVFMTYDWFRAWNHRRAQEHRSGVRRPEILILKKNGTLAGIAPLIYRVTRRFGFKARKLESLASPADYNDFVVGDDPAGQIGAIVDHLVQTKGQWDMVDLKSLRETGNVQASIEASLSRTSLIHRILPEDRCPYLPIDAPWAEMLGRLSRSSCGPLDGLHTLRKKQHRLERMRAEGLRVRIVEAPQDEPELLEKLVALENQKHIKEEPMSPLLSRYPEVFQSLFDTLGVRGWIYVALMELGDRPLAWLMGFRCGKKLWGYQTAYDHFFSRLSPGTMLIPAVLDYGFSLGYEEYDFLRDDMEPYKLRWSTGYHQTFRLQIWNSRWMARAYRVWEAMYRLFGPRG